MLKVIEKDDFVEFDLAAKPKASRNGIMGIHDGAMKVDEEVRRFCRQKGIALIELRTAEAVKKYNEIEGPGVIGAFHLTC